MPNRWDEQYSTWLRARAAYFALLAPAGPEVEKESQGQFQEAELRYGAASEDLFLMLRPVIKRAAGHTIRSWPAITACTTADDLAAEVESNLARNPPPELFEGYIAVQLKNRACSIKKKLMGSDEVSIDDFLPPGDDGPGRAPEIPDPPKTAEWPTYATLPEPVRGYIALFKHIEERVRNETDACTYSQTGWFSGVPGEGVRQKNRRETKRMVNRASSGNSVLDSAHRRSEKVTQEFVNLLNAEMLGTHSALTISFRALCAEDPTATNPFSAESVETMSLITRRGSDPSVAEWAIGLLSGVQAAIPEELAKCTERVLGNRAKAADIRYFLGCVSLYLRAYSILLIPSLHGEAERHWTELAAPMTPRAADIPNYRTRAKGYHCLEKYLPKSAEGNHAND